MHDICHFYHFSDLEAHFWTFEAPQEASEVIRSEAAFNTLRY